MIDPDEELGFAYFPNQTIAMFETASDRLPVPTFAASFYLTVGQLFGWLAE